MRLWVDGGSLHSLRRCIRGEGLPVDAYDQLHLAVQLAFAETLVVGTFRDPTYARKTEKAVRTLVGLGFEPECVEVVDSSEEDLAAIYRTAGDVLAPRLRHVVDAFHGIARPIRLEPHIQALEDRFDRAIRQDLSPSDRAALYQEVRDRDNNGLTILLAKSDLAWSAIRAIVRRAPEWTAAHTAALAAVCRVYIHDALAESADAAYAPDWRRAKALKDTLLGKSTGSNPSAAFAEHLQNEVGRLAALPTPLLLGRIPVPPVAAYLVREAAGEPRALFHVALSLRAKTVSLRRYLTDAVHTSEARDGDEGMARCNDLLADLRAVTSEPRATRRLAAFDLVNINAAVVAIVALAQGANWSPSVAGVLGLFSLGAGLKAANKTRKRRRVAVLSQIANDLKRNRIDRLAFDALETNVSARRSD